jgi:hypothetical protein
MVHFFLSRSLWGVDNHNSSIKFKNTLISCLSNNASRQPSIQQLGSRVESWCLTRPVQGKSDPSKGNALSSLVVVVDYVYHSKSQLAHWPLFLCSSDGCVWVVCQIPHDMVHFCHQHIQEVWRRQKNKAKKLFKLLCIIVVYTLKKLGAKLAAKDLYSWYGLYI